MYCMNVRVEIIEKNAPEEAVFRVHEETEEIKKLMKQVEQSGCTVLCSKDDDIYNIPLSEIFYFEVVDGKSFVYSSKDMFDCKLKLFEFEEITRNTLFFRASKSTIVNAEKIEYVKPSVSRRFEAHLENNEIITVNRKYVIDMKRSLSIM